jgi:hypothetical protein
MLKQISHRKIVKRRPLYHKGESFGCIGYFLGRFSALPLGLPEYNAGWHQGVYPCKLLQHLWTFKNSKQHRRVCGSCHLEISCFPSATGVNNPSLRIQGNDDAIGNNLGTASDPKQYRNP